MTFIYIWSFYWLLILKYFNLNILIIYKYYTMEVNGAQLFIIQNIFFCVQQKKEIHKGLGELEGE